MKTTTAILLAGLIAWLSPSAARAQGGDPCAMLTMAEIQQAFPAARPGVRDRDLEKSGIVRCSWNHPGGLLVLLASDEEETAKEGAESMLDTFLDPLRNDARGRVRYEALSGVGDQAVVVLEREDKAKGFMRDGAILVVQRGKYQVVLLSSELGRRERAEGLRVFTELGKAIAKRLH